MAFVHLHNHTDYSLLDGAGSVKAYVNKAKELGMKALAITDHGNMYGAVTFYDACRDAKIKPIVGCEFYNTPDSEIKNPNDKYSHLVLLAMNDKGYHNLMKLQALSWTKGFYYKPRIDDKMLEAYSDNLICLSGCVSGELSRLVLADKNTEAEKRMLWYYSVFKERYFVEIQNHGLEDERKAFSVLVKLARKHNIPFVATNDCHYIEKDDWDAHDTLLCINTKSLKSDSDRVRYKPGEFYVRTESEMRSLFPGFEDAIENTNRISDMCNLEIAFPGPVLPKCTVPTPFKSADEYLVSLAYEGLPKRYPNATESEMTNLKKRLQHELDIIITMKFPAYFLIVQDYINWAKNHDIPVGPGRGSGAGSLVAYSLKITDVDPIKYDLLFERFLNPDRVSLPDFDVDFDYERREEVIKYVTQHYGEDHVGQIVTFSQEKPKQIIKDVARVFGLSVAESNEITALIPDEIPNKKHWGLKDALEIDNKLCTIRDRNMTYKKLFEHAMRLEGLNRHTSLHAAGVVISYKPLSDYVPLAADSMGNVATQYTMLDLERCGLVKMDFLGLKTLTLIRNTESLIRKKDPTFSIESIKEDDKTVFEMLSRGDSSCVFQFESSGMKDILRQSQPRCIEDLVALNALYRPGPMQFIPKFIDSKLGRCKITYPDECLEPILKTTYGVIVYQEQVMQVAQRIAGYTLGEADILRRIMGKKKVDKMAEELVKFRARAEENGFDPNHAEEIFHILEPFAGYGFNKSHAVAYTIIAYRTAWLKCHYPEEFMAANLTNEIGNPDKFKEYLNLAGHSGLTVTAPSINLSERTFTVKDDKIVYGLEGIKNVGSVPASQIIEEREKNGGYSSFIDFVTRQPVALGSKVLESLIKCGCFDSLNEKRATLLFNLKDVIKWDKKRRNTTVNDQMLLFESEKPSFDLIETDEMSFCEKLQLEKELLGYYISGHPTDIYKEDIDKCVSVDLSDPSTWRLGVKTALVVEVTSARTLYAKKTGKPFTAFTYEDKRGSMESLLIGKEFNQYAHLIRENSVVALKGVFEKDPKSGNIRFKIAEVLSPSALPAKPISILHVRLEATASVKDAQNIKIALKKIRSDVGLRIMISSDVDPYNEILLSSRADPDLLDLDALRNIKNVNKVWTE